MKVFPLPHDRADFNTALQRASIAAAAGAKNVKPQKLIPRYGHVSKRRTPAELKAIAMGMVTRKS